ncbi:MAG: MerR family transcriptional regulator [Pseudomonadota bacterium]
MGLKIGELARRAGLTVRALHHYHAIGLLLPSARSDAGYRLYNGADAARLHQIQALRKLGLSLAEVGAALADPGLSFAAIVARQIAMLTRQIDQASALRNRLLSLQTQLEHDTLPPLGDCLRTLELMALHDNYFSPAQLSRLRTYRAAPAETAVWRALVDAVQALLEQGVRPDHPHARRLAVDWMTRVVRDTNGEPAMFDALRRMHEAEPLLHAETAITPAMQRFVGAAFQESKLALYRHYLSNEEFAHLRAHYGKHNAQWPPLIAQVRAAMDQARPAHDQTVQQLARQWFTLFRAYAGDRPETQIKFRQAHLAEPELLAGTWVDQAMLDYISASMATLTGAPAPCHAGRAAAWPTRVRRN